MKVLIRKTIESDFIAVSNIIKESFKNDIHSDHREQFLVEKLRKSENFIQNLSLVAIINEEIVGYVGWSNTVD